MKKHLARLVIAILLITTLAAITACAKGTSTDTPDDEATAGSDSQSAADLLARGENYLSRGNYTEAIFYFNKTLEKSSKRVAAYIGLAQAHSQLGDMQAAAEALNTGLEKTGDDSLRQTAQSIYDDLLTQDAAKATAFANAVNATEQFQDAPLQTAPTQAPVTPTPAPTPTPTPPVATGPSIRRPVADGYYMAGRTVTTADLKISIDAPGGTGDHAISIYVSNLDGSNRKRLTDSASAWGSVFLAGDKLYFTYYDAAEDMAGGSCWIDVRTGGAPNLLGFELHCATDDYFFYFKPGSYSTLYRANADLTNERVFINLPSEIFYPWATAHKIYLFEGTSDTPDALVVYNEDGTRLRTIDMRGETSGFSRGIELNNVYYWYQAEGDYETPSPKGTIHAYDLSSGVRLADIPLQLPNPGMHGGIAKIEGNLIYLVTAIEDTPTTHHNTALYTMPLAGGIVQLVQTWFES